MADRKIEKKLLLAVAGSGKTWFLADYANHNDRALFITFTNENIKNLENEIAQKHTNIPDNVKVMTYHHFLHSYVIRPNELRFNLNRAPITSRGVSINKPPQPKNEDGTYNVNYIKKDNIFHYLTRRCKYYNSRLSSLYVEQKKIILPLLKERIEKHYDAIYIDEIQDFIGHDYDFIIDLFSKVNTRIIAVGDFYQHSVTPSATDCSSRRPFKKGRGKSARYISIDEYIKLYSSKGIEVDPNSLSKCRRCPSVVCNFVESKLNIKIKSDRQSGSIMQLDPNDAERVINDSYIEKLVYSKSKDHIGIRATNWGYSKGDTFKDTCVILTQDFKNISDTHFTLPSNVPQSTINKLYVALTRATDNVYLITNRDFLDIIKLEEKNQ